MADVGHDHIFRRWTVQLRRDSFFKQMLQARWNELKHQGLKQWMIERALTHTTQLINSGAQQQNFSKWPVLNTQVYREVYHSGTYTEHVDFLINYLTERYEWMDTEINGSLANHLFWLRDVNTGHYLKVHSNNTYLQLSEDLLGTMNDQWELIRQVNGSFLIKNKGSKAHLAKRGGTQVGIVYEQLLDPANSFWQISYWGDDQYVVFDSFREKGLQTGGGEAWVYGFNDADEYTNKNRWLDRPEEGKWQLIPSGTPLPISVDSFAAHIFEGAIKLIWQITEQQNGSHVEIERLTEYHEEFLSIGRVELSAVQSFVDTTPRQGLNIYRLKLVDLDGSMNYSKWISIWWGANEQMLLYPNPIRDVLNLSKDIVSAGLLEMEIRAVSGVRIEVPLDVKTIEQSGRIALDNLMLGVYLLGVKLENGWKYFKFIKA